MFANLHHVTFSQAILSVPVYFSSKFKYKIRYQFYQLQRISIATIGKLLGSILLIAFFIMAKWKIVLSDVPLDVPNHPSRRLKC